LPGLGRANVAREILAGITLIALSVPLNIGYAQIAGLPPTAGLYALVLPSLVFALTASSRQLVIAPDAAAAALVSSSLVGLAVAGSADYASMAAAQAILSGVVLLLAGRLKLGFLADFLSHPILLGFVGGLALEVMVSQVAKMLGVSIDSGAEFWEKAAELCAGLPSTHPASLLLSVVALTVLIAGRRWSPGAPWALLVMVAATAASVLLRFQDAGIAVLGEVASGPPQIAFPLLAVSQWIALVPSALALSAVVLAEGLLVARSYAEKHGDPHQPDRDLVAAGLANLAAGVSGSFNVGSSTSRTAAMDAAGSRTQLPSVVLAAGSLLLLLFGTKLLEAVPSPVIGAIVAVAVFRLLGLSELVSLWGESRAEFAVAAVCVLGVLVLGPIRGLLVAFVLALVNLARQAAAPPLEVLADPDSSDESVLAARADGRDDRPRRGRVPGRRPDLLRQREHRREADPRRRGVRPASGPVGGSRPGGRLRHRCHRCGAAAISPDRARRLRDRNRDGEGPAGLACPADARGPAHQRRRVPDQPGGSGGAARPHGLSAPHGRRLSLRG